jgi:hypothetical protein
MTNKPERSVEEILTFVEVDEVGIVVKKNNNKLYLTISGSEEYITDLTGLDPTLQAERQRCDEMVEAEGVRVNEKWLSAIDVEIEEMNAQGSVFQEMTDRIMSTALTQSPTPLTNDKE